MPKMWKGWASKTAIRRIITVREIDTCRWVTVNEMTESWSKKLLWVQLEQEYAKNMEWVSKYKAKRRRICMDCWTPASPAQQIRNCRQIDKIPVWKTLYGTTRARTCQNRESVHETCTLECKILLLRRCAKTLLTIMIQHRQMCYFRLQLSHCNTPIKYTVLFN